MIAPHRRTEQLAPTPSKIREGVLSAPCYNKYLVLHILLTNAHLSRVLVRSADLADTGPSHRSPRGVQEVGTLGTAHCPLPLGGGLKGWPRSASPEGKRRIRILFRIALIKVVLRIICASRKRASLKTQFSFDTSTRCEARQLVAYGSFLRML